MFLVTVLVENIAPNGKSCLMIFFAASGVAQKYNCSLSNVWTTSRSRALCPLYA